LNDDRRLMCVTDDIVSDQQIMNEHSRKMTDPKARPPWTSSEIPSVLTFVYPPPDAWEPRYQLQWDYQIEWPRAGRPTITLLRFRSYQQKNAESKAELVEDITDDIPVNDLGGHLKSGQ